MNKSLFLLSCAASLALASCNQDKPAAVDAATTPAADTAVVVDNAQDLTVYRDQGNRTADIVANDLGITDTAQVTRVRTVYYNRARRLGELETRYTADTTGRYAAVRQLNTETDTEIKTVFNDDARYRTYETNRAKYYGSGYDEVDTDEATAENTSAAAARPARRRGPAIVKYDSKKGGDTKIKYANGTTVKIDKDGDRKVEYRDGTKVKRDADDGKRKVKD